MKTDVEEFINKLQRKSISIRVLISALGGTLIASTFIYPFSYAKYQHLAHHNDNFLNVMNFFKLMLSGPELALWVCIFASPLIILVMVASVVLKKLIERHLVLWCFIAPIGVSILGAAFYFLTSDTDKSILRIILQEDYLLWGPLPSSLIFYWISPKESNKANKASEDSES